MKTEDLIQEMERNRRLSELESTPRKAHDYFSAMPDKEMINRYIEYLISQSEAKDLQNRSLQLKIEELTEKFGESTSKINDLLDEIRLLRKELSASKSETRSYRKKISKLEEQLKAAKAEKYGRKRSKSKDDDNDGGMSSCDRSESEENFDGSGGQSVEQPVSDSKECGSSAATGQTFNAANRPETYRSMGMTVSKNTLRNWLKKGKKHLDSLIPMLKDAALEKDAIVNCDETWCKVRRFNRYTKKYVWVLVNKAQGVVIFFYDEGSRGRKVLTDFLGDADLKAQMSDGYNAYTFLDGELEKTGHLICMAHAKVKFSKAYEHGEDDVAKEFENMISELYDLEEGYRLRELSEEDIAAERQGAYTESIVQRIRKRLDEELRKDNEFRSPYMMQALNYLNHFWDGFFLYRKDGSYPIDNNLAERSVRPFTTKRKCSLHFGSDEGAEMSAVYHSIISTLKLCGKSVWNFFGDFFRCEVLGQDTYKDYLPALNR